MDSQSIFSAFSLVATITHMYVGLYAYKHNVNSIINKVFLLLCICYAIWSFAYAFAYTALNNHSFYIWNKISALGWCSFSSISLYLALLITENKIVTSRLLKILIFFPAFLFLFMAVFLFGDSINTPNNIAVFFNIGNFLYNFIFLLTSIILIFIWGIKSESNRVKIQSKILVISSAIPFILNLFIQDIGELSGHNTLPYMGQLLSLIMIFGTYIVITKYKFLTIPKNVIFEEVENKIIDMIMVINENGRLIKISQNTLKLLDLHENEMINQDISVLFKDPHKELFSLIALMQEEVIYQDIYIYGKNHKVIPVNVHCIPLWDKRIHDFLGAAIIMQNISIEHELRRKNKELQEKSIRDGLTKLYNHQYSVEIIKREIDFLSDTNKDFLSLMMIDIDYFKKVNDTYGHIFGDKVLITVAKILLKLTKNKGYVGRFGGEEFIVILPKTSPDKSYELAEQMRSEIQKFNFGNSLKLTVSIGLKQYDNQLSIDFLTEADNLLYKAKQNGRNRVESG